MATTIELNGRVREGRGKGAARKLRLARRIPGVLYGKGVSPVPIDLDEREFTRVVAGHSVSNLILDLKMDEGGTVKTLVREVQTNPLSGSVEHVDLNRISLTEEILVEVPIEIVGVAVGVKTSGGIMQTPMRTLAVRCLPQNLPDKISVDVTALEIGMAIHVRDLVLTGLTVVSDPDTTLVNVIHPVKEEEVKPPEPVAGAAAAPAEPELVEKKKKPEAEGEESK
jgi:large subunit ribosomal protein L25